MLQRNHPDRIQITFDDRRLVANAGLILPATLALRLGLPELVQQRLDLGNAPLCRLGHVPERRRDEYGAGMQGLNHAWQLVPANCDRCTSVPNIFHPFSYPTLPLRSDRWQANHGRYRTPRMPWGSHQVVYPTDSASSSAASAASAASANSAKAISASRARAVPRLRTFLYRPHLISASMNRW